LRIGEIEMPAMIRLRDVKALTGLGRSTIYSHIEKGLLPKQVSLGARAVGWPDYEIATINAARVAGKSDDEIVAIVRDLEAARKTAC
jgi:prophage regulatory protein